MLGFALQSDTGTPDDRNRDQAPAPAPTPAAGMSALIEQNKTAIYVIAAVIAFLAVIKAAQR